MELPELPLGYELIEDRSRHVIGLVRRGRWVAWIDGTAAKAGGGQAFTHWLDRTLYNFGVAPVRLLPTRRKLEPEFVPDWPGGGADPGYLWHLFMGRDPDTYRSSPQAS